MIVVAPLEEGEEEDNNDMLISNPCWAPYLFDATSVESAKLAFVFADTC
jgi:hypothetical protein